MIPKQTRDGYPIRQGRGVMPGGAETFQGYGQGWANVSNTPFREYKHWEHEGGISTPLIAHWPAGIPESRHGVLEKQPGHLIELMATCVDLGGAGYPRQKSGQPIPAMEGVSLRPALSGESIGERPLFWEHEGSRAIRKGNWKAVAENNQAWELYNLADDRTENKNLAENHPKILQELITAHEVWSKK
eukprot:gene48590-59502_t